VDADTQTRRQADKQKELISSNIGKPSSGLEPETPSLPWRFRGVTRVHARSRATQFALQIGLVGTKITQPTLVANGDNDRMVPSTLSEDLHRRVEGSELIIYPDSGHGGIFQFHDRFAPAVVEFLGR
jgi:pimeloyl-ACP methyl ester carboxylesterase